MGERNVSRPSGLELLILAALDAREQYGLEIVDTVRQVTDGATSISLGALYTTLHRMEKKGLVASKWGGASKERRGARRRYYRLEGVGIRALSLARASLVPLQQLARHGSTS